MEYYLNEKRLYKYDDAIGCYYSYEDTCILQGIVNWKKELVIAKEYHFEKESKHNIAKLIDFTYPWINKNEYFAQVVGKCYCLDFSDEEDIAMLTDEFQEIKDNNRFIYEAEKTNTNNREKCLQLIVKALSYSLNSTYTGNGLVTCDNKNLADPRKILYRDYDGSKAQYRPYIGVLHANSRSRSIIEIENERWKYYRNF